MLSELRFALRSLVKTPGLTIVIILTLAIGIGACAAIFSVVDGVLLRPLPYSNPDRLVVAEATWLPKFPEFAVSPGDFLDWQQQSSDIAQFASVRHTALSLTGLGAPLRVDGASVSVNWLSTLGIAPTIGRDFLPEEGTAGHDRVAIISHRLWLEQFGGRADVLEHSLRLDGRVTKIIGVLPPLPESAVAAQLLVPAVFGPAEHQDHGGHALWVIGRLKAGVTLARAQIQMSTIAGRLAQSFPDTNKGWDVKLMPLLEATVRGVRLQFWVLLGAVGFLLIIACVNVANLLSARAAGRSKEIAVRAAIGASRTQIMRQLLVEHLLLALVGGLLGVLAACGGLQLLLALAPADIPRLDQVMVNRDVLGFSLALVISVGISCGLAPAYGASRVDLNTALKDAIRGSGVGGRQQKMSRGLVAAQLAIALILLVGAGLLMQSLTRLLRVDPGFQPHGVLRTNVSVSEQTYSTPARVLAFTQEVLARLARLPEVKFVGATQVLPFQGGMYLAFRIDGKSPARVSDQPSTNYFAVTPDYFKAMGIALIRGRDFTEHDSADAPRVAIINEEMARKFFPNEDPIGKRISIANGPEAWREIIGVVRNVKLSGLDSETVIQTYEPFAQSPFPFFTIVMRVSRQTPGLAAQIRAALRSVDRDQPIDDILPLDDLVASSVATRRFAAELLTTFSIVAAFLAALGIYGVSAHSVGQRVNEFGVRIALGARQRDILLLILWQVSRITAIGMMVGLVGALLLYRLLGSMLYEIAPGDPATLTAASLGLALVAFIGCLLPAIRAMRVDPIIALQSN
jgi:putative ABC transport system permease protein